MVGWFAELYRRRGKSKVMLLNGEEGIECKVHVDEPHLVQVLFYKYIKTKIFLSMSKLDLDNLAKF